MGKALINDSSVRQLRYILRKLIECCNDEQFRKVYASIMNRAESFVLMYKAFGANLIPRCEFPLLISETELGVIYNRICRFYPDGRTAFNTLQHSSIAITDREQDIDTANIRIRNTFARISKDDREFIYRCYDRLCTESMKRTIGGGAILSVFGILLTPIIGPIGGTVGGGVGCFSANIAYQLWLDRNLEHRKNWKEVRANLKRISIHGNTVLRPQSPGIASDVVHQQANEILPVNTVREETTFTSDALELRKRQVQQPHITSQYL